MRLISVNVGLPRELSWKGKAVTTAIFKEPLAGRVPLRTLNIDGDRQADLSVHGGPSKAVYVYPAEHYEYWRSELGDQNLNWGMFGENFTTEGLSEDCVNIGDRFRIGSVELMVTEPRMPCYKLAMKFGRDDMIKRFLASGRTGFYFSVTSEGEVGAGDDITLTHRDQNDVSVAEITRLYARDKNDLEATRRAMKVEALPESWKHYFQRRLG
ncbi:MAG: MOSC domain-containing protein [Blastocatellia bacterium]